MNNREKILIDDIENMRYMLEELKKHVEFIESTLDSDFEYLTQPNYDLK